MLFVLTRRRLKIGAVAAILAVSILVAERLYVSDRDRVQAALDRMVAAVQEGDADALIAELAHDYLDEGLRLEDMRRIAVNFFNAYGPTRVRIASSTITVSDRVANADLSVHIGLPQHPTAGMPMEWRLGFVRMEDRWRVDSVTPISMGGIEIRDLSSLASRYGLNRGGPPWGRLHREAQNPPGAP